MSRLSADASTANTTATDSGLQFEIGPNEIWTFEIIGACQKSTLTAGQKFAVAVPTAAVFMATVFAGLAAGTFADNQLTASGTLSATAFNTQAAVDRILRVHGTVVNGANAGQVKFQHASITSGNSIIKANTILVARRIA